jgi:hypothetical protein
MPTDEVDRLLAEFVALRTELEGTWEERRLLMEHGTARGHVDAGAVAALWERSAQLRAAFFAVNRQLHTLVLPGTLAPYYSWRPPPHND